jgi:hypothetical protein
MHGSSQAAPVAIRLQTCTTPAQRISHLAAIQAILTANPALTLPSRLKAYVSQAWENNNGEADVNAIQDVIDWVCDTLQEQHIEDFMISPQYQVRGPAVSHTCAQTSLP